MDITLQAGEAKIDTWTIYYLSPNGGKYNGKLTVTNRRLLYDAKFDASLAGQLSGAFSIRWSSAGYLEINKEDIRGMDVQKKLFSKRCTLTLADGTQHAFDYGAMNIDKVVEAIQAR